VATAEKRALIWLARRIPSGVNPDVLTIIGFASQCGAGLCYALARVNPDALLLGIVCLALNWLGDSLDGTLARLRNQERPRYGFYVDHIADTIAAFFLMGGLALSGYAHPTVAMGMLVAFLMLSIEAYLATYSLGQFELSHSTTRSGSTATSESDECRTGAESAHLAKIEAAEVLHGGRRRHRRSTGNAGGACRDGLQLSAGDCAGG
jgi:phosphatidylglycerophosphate synthase